MTVRGVGFLVLFALISVDLQASNQEETQVAPPICLKCLQNKDMSQLMEVKDEIAGDTQDQACADIDPAKRLSSLEFSKQKKDSEKTFFDTILSGFNAVKKVQDKTYGILPGIPVPISCLYGTAEGALSSARDFIKFFAKDIWVGLYKGGSWAAEKATSYVKSWFSKDGEQFTEANAIGAAGAVSAQNLAHPEDAVTKVLDFFKGAFGAIKNLVLSEVHEFKCLTPEAKEEYICKAVGYLAVDFFTGKITLSMLAKLPVVRVALQKTILLFQKSEELKSIGTAILSLRKLPGATEALRAAKWVENAENKAQEIAVLADGKVFVRNLSKKGEYTYALVVNEKKAAQLAEVYKAGKVLDKVIPGVERFKVVEAAKKSGVSLAEHLQSLTKEMGHELSTNDAKKLAQKLSASTKYSDEYSELAKAISEKRKPLIEKIAKDLIEGKVDKKLIEEDYHQRELWDEINKSMVKMGKGEELNLTKILKDLNAAGPSTDVAQVYKKLLKEINSETAPKWVKALKGEKPKTPEESFTRKTEQFIKASFPGETDAVVEQTKNCIVRNNRTASLGREGYDLCER
jgi:hypothetical protein